MLTTITPARPLPTAAPSSDPSPVCDSAEADGAWRLRQHRARSTTGAFWFGEDQSRYVLAVPDAGPVLAAASAAGVPAVRLGTAGGDGLTLPGGVLISLERLRTAHERFFPAWMES